LKNLIVNADDLGWTEGINRESRMPTGADWLTSTSLLANGRAFESGLAVRRNHPELGVAVHLNLSDGHRRLGCQRPGLLNKAGNWKAGRKVCFCASPRGVFRGQGRAGMGCADHEDKKRRIRPRISTDTSTCICFRVYFRWRCG